MRLRALFFALLTMLRPAFAEEVRIGVVSAQTGAAAAYDEPFLQGVRMYAEEANARGGSAPSPARRRHCSTAPWAALSGPAARCASTNAAPSLRSPPGRTPQPASARRRHERCAAL